MTRSLRMILLAGLALCAPLAHASYHTFQIDEIYTNADGTVQFVVLREAAGMNAQNLLSGQMLSSTTPAGTANLVFRTDLSGGTCYYGMCMQSPTAFSHVLIATRGFVALGLVTPDYVMPDGFLAPGGGTLNYAGFDQWTYGPLPTDGVNALFRSGGVKENVGVNFKGASVIVALAAPAPPSYHGLWWNPDADGSGINLSHQGDQIFATWYTYDTSGNAFWLSMLASRTTPAGAVYGGDIYIDSGPPLNNFTGSATATKVGTGTLSFSDANYGSFAYDIVSAGGASNVQQSEFINRFVLDGTTPQPVCAYAAAPDLAGATNYQDLWWAPSESGWGVDFAHQGNQLFATWYTYDAKSAGAGNPPMWLSALMQRQGMSNVFTGPLNRTSGPRFDSYVAMFDTQQVGTATTTFADGNHATFAYVTDGTGGLPAINQSKTITRFLFAAPAGNDLPLGPRRSRMPA